MKNRSNLILAFATIITITFLSSCKKDDNKPNNPNDPNETELVTTVKLNFVDSAGVSPNLSFLFRDIDGDGGNAPSRFDTIRLAENKTYILEILLLDESKFPADTISNEVAIEADDHMFFFLHTGVNINTTYLDLDSNGLPLGLLTKWISGTASTGTSKITLKHQPGIKNGTLAPGETDVELNFQSVIE